MLWSFCAIYLSCHTHTISANAKELEGNKVNTLQYIRCTAIYYNAITSSHVQGKMSLNCAIVLFAEVSKWSLMYVNWQKESFAYLYRKYTEIRTLCEPTFAINWKMTPISDFGVSKVSKDMQKSVCADLPKLAKVRKKMLSSGSPSSRPKISEFLGLQFPHTFQGNQFLWKSKHFC